MTTLKRLLTLLLASLLLLVPASFASGAPGGGPGKPPGVGNGGGGQQSPGNKLGDLYADLWVIARYANGTPEVTALGGALCLRPITDTSFAGAVQVPEAGYYPYPVDMYYLPLVGQVPTLLAEEEEDELAPCDVVAEYTNLIEEEDLGRLNLGRAPERVLDKQLRDVQALLGIPPVSLDASGRFVNGLDATLDSPLGNLAAFQAILEMGRIGAIDPATMNLPLDSWELTAAQLAAGAPKEGFEITVDTVQYLNRILRIPDQTILPTIPSASGEEFLDFSGFEYVREDVFPGCLTWYPVGSSELVELPLIDAALGGDTAVAGNGIDGYVKFAEDAHKVLVFLHALGDNVQAVDSITESIVCTP
jgi:hypothetical protein